MPLHPQLLTSGFFDETKELEYCIPLNEWSCPFQAKSVQDGVVRWLTDHQNEAAPDST